MKLKELEIKNDSIFFKLEQGDNKLRLVSSFVTKEVMFDGAKKPTTRYCCWVIDRRDGEIRWAELGISIIKQFKKLHDNPDYTFDVIPKFDITVNRVGEKLNTEYTVLPNRKDTPLTKEEQKKIDELDSPEDFLAKLAKKAKEKKTEDIEF